MIDDASRARLRAMIGKLANQHTYEGGVGGTCYECLYASEPLRSDGTVAPWREVSNDPTEAYFACSLPGRPARPEWGEYAPCTVEQWAAVTLALFDELLPPWPGPVPTDPGPEVPSSGRGDDRAGGSDDRA